MEIKSSRPVGLNEAKEILETREKAGEELGYEQQQALEYLKKYAKDDEKEVLKELTKSKKIPLETAVKLAEVRPKSPNTVKAITLKDKVELNEEEIAEVIKTLGK
jgi:DNA-directed RNA polymerase subunit F